VEEGLANRTAGPDHACNDARRQAVRLENAGNLTTKRRAGSLVVILVVSRTSHLAVDTALTIDASIASVTRGVVDAPFQMLQLPAIIDIARFQPKTAQGKLNAEMIATLPRGFHVSSSVCPGRSEGMICPAIVRLKPTARSQMSINSCTSPTP